MFIQQVCHSLDEAKIRYAVVGGYAVAIHGAIRGTLDVDIAINWSLNNLVKVESELKKLGLVSTLPITAENVYHFRDEYINTRNLIAWNFYQPGKPQHQVDIIINYDLKNSHVETVETREGKIRVLGVKDLIEMKRKSGRPQDLEDIRALEAL